MTSSHWALSLKLAMIHRAYPLRTTSGIEAAMIDDTVWLRGEGLDAVKHRQLAPVADGPVFQLSPNGWLTPWGRAVPVAALPALQWMPLREFVVPTVPAAFLPGFTPALSQTAVTQISLVRTSVEREPELLLAPVQLWCEWAEMAAEVRLHACRFALSNSPTRMVLIRGRPLPPLPGTRFWMAGQVALPLGWTWSPAVDIATLTAVLSAVSPLDRRESHRLQSESDLLLWELTENLIHQIPVSDFVPATRANIRHSATPPKVS